MRLSIGFNPLPGWECDPVFTPLIIMRSFIKNQYHGQIAMLKANGPLVRLTLPLTYGFMVRNGRRDHKPTSNLQNFPVSSRARTTSGSRPLTSGSRRVNAETNKLWWLSIYEVLRTCAKDAAAEEDWEELVNVKRLAVAIHTPENSRRPNVLTQGIEHQGRDNCADFSRCSRDPMCEGPVFGWKNWRSDCKVTGKTKNLRLTFSRVTLKMILKSATVWEKLSKDTYICRTEDQNRC